MEGNQIIMTGEKGLFLSDGKKIYFPDRSFKDAEEGFVKNVKVVKDKGTYAFVTGEMVRNVPMSEDEMKSIVREHGDALTNFYKGKFLGTDAVVSFKSTSGELPTVYIDGKEFCKLESGDAKYNVRMLFTQIDTSYFTVMDWMQNAKEVSTDEMMLSLVRIYMETWERNTIAVFGNKVAKMSGSREFFKCHMDKNKLIRIESNRTSDAEEVVSGLIGGHNYVVDFSNVCDWAKENYVAFEKVGGYKNGTVKHTFSFMNNSCNLILFGGTYLNMETFQNEHTKEVVRKSAENFESWLRQCGRVCTGKNVSSLSPVLSTLKSFRGY